MRCSMDDWAQGYMDGRDLDCPEPGDNQSDEYRHSFDVGRREVQSRTLSAQAYRQRAAKITESKI